MELPTHALCDTPIRYITHEGASWFSLNDTMEKAQDLSEQTRRQRIELRSCRAHIEISALRVLTSHAGVLRRTAKTLQEHAVARHGLIHVDTAVLAKPVCQLISIPNCCRSGEKALTGRSVLQQACVRVCECACVRVCQTGVRVCCY